MVRRTYVLVTLGKYLTVIFMAFSINFIIPRMVPGDPITDMLTRMEYTAFGVAEYEKVLSEFRRLYGLDGSWLTQYICYFQRLFVGDLGVSIAWFPLKVNDLIFRALPWTIGLLSFTTLIAWTVGNILGAIAGWFRESKMVSAFTIVAICFGEIPYYILAIIFVFIFAYLLKAFPLGAHELLMVVPALSLDYILTVLRNTALPALSLVVVGVARWVVSMRAMITSVMGEDYVRYAEAKGLKRNVILMRYAFRNALLPQVTGLGISLGWIVSGALLTETIFGFPGIGMLLYDAAIKLDYNVVQGITLMITLSVCTATLILDLVYPLLDPRIRYERA